MSKQVVKCVSGLCHGSIVADEAGIGLASDISKVIMSNFGFNFTCESSCNQVVIDKES